MHQGAQRREQCEAEGGLSRPRKRSKKTEARRATRLAESAYKLGVTAGAKEMAARSVRIMQEHLDDMTTARYLGDLFGYIGLAVWLKGVVDESR